MSTQIENIFSQAFSLHQQGHLVQAASLYEQVLKMQANHFDALHLLGVLLFQQGESEQALASLDKAIAVKPRHPYVHFNRGNVLNRLGKYEAAIQSYQQAVHIYPDYAEAHHNLGFVLKEIGRYDAAIQSFARAIELQPHDADAYNNLGLVYFALQQYTIAIQNFNSAIELHPDYAEAYNNRGIALESLRQFEAAVASYDQAIVLNPNFAEAYNNRGNALQALKQLEAALQNYSLAIAIKPDYVDAYYNQGIIFTKLKQYVAAIDSFQFALAMQANNVEGYNSLGNAYRELGRYDDAMQQYATAVALNPDYAAANFNLGLCYLLTGDFKRGWEKYELRRAVVQVDLYEQAYHQPQLVSLASINNKVILLHSEQGLGDTLQFCRYSKLIADLGGKVVFEVDAPLVELFANLAGVEQLIPKGGRLPVYDYHCPLLSLPYLFNTDLNNIPVEKHYLTCNKDKLQAWEAKLGVKDRPRIGLVWSGNANHAKDSSRSISLSDVVGLLSSRWQFVCLQQEVRATDLELLAARHDILYFGDELRDFSDTAALVEAMDLVISVDTGVAHLAGALGKSVWLLLPVDPDWRWLLQRTDSPWYPSIKLYRQTQVGDWGKVILDIKSDLEKQFS